MTDVQKAIDADEYVIHAILPTGHSQHLWFYLIVWETPHRDAGQDGIPDGTTLLKERYFQLPKQGAPADLEPTFKTNGIHRRDDGDLKHRIVRAYARVSNTQGMGDPDDPLWLPEADDRGEG